MTVEDRLARVGRRDFADIGVDVAAGAEHIAARKSVIVEQRRAASRRRNIGVGDVERPVGGHRVAVAVGNGEGAIGNARSGAVGGEHIGAVRHRLDAAVIDRDRLAEAVAAEHQQGTVDVGQAATVGTANKVEYAIDAGALGDVLLRFVGRAGTIVEEADLVRDIDRTRGDGIAVSVGRRDRRAKAAAGKRKRIVRVRVDRVIEA